MPYQVIYSSRASSPPVSASELERILVDARAGNARRGVSGVLMYADGVFVQILEGEREVVEALVESIRADTRHEAMKVFHAQATDERAFSDWRMAYLSADADDMARWAGLDGVSSVSAVLERLHADPSRVPRILISIVKAIAAQSSGR